MTPEQLQAIRDRATRPRRTVPVVLDGALREQIEQLEGELADLSDEEDRDQRLGSKRKQTRAQELQSQIDALYERAAESTLLAVIEAMPSTTYRALVTAHPPRKGEDGKALPSDNLLGVNEETFRPALVRHCIIGHRTTLEDEDVHKLEPDFVDWLMEFVSDRQMDTLFAAAFGVNRGDDAVPTQRRRSTTRSSAGA